MADIESLSARGPTATGTDTQSAVRRQVETLAHEFEAMLMTQMLRDMRRSMLEDSGESSEFSSIRDTFDVEFGRAMSLAGGVGLSASLLKSLSRLAETASSAAAVETDAGPAVLPSAPEDRADVGVATDSGQPEVAPVAAPVTSAFGWRRDPTNGAAAFHPGVDIGVAYGQDVRAAASGTVVFAGPRGGYGHMVSVKHPDGRETRYAHLSAELVRVGEAVQAGQVLGRSGSTGRSTGPHLHFEVLVDGHPVDPGTTTKVL
jgi:murein DD-endopeptidase MepM/ murein hydrolase activator NlpD